MSTLRRTATWLVVGSFGFAGLLGIAALLLARTDSPTLGRVIGTTLVIGVVSVGALCYLSVTGRRSAALAAIGAATALAAAAITLWIIWSGAEPSETVGKTLGLLVTYAASIAQACLVLAAADRTRLETPLVDAALVMIAVVAGFITVGIVFEPDTTVYARAFGIAAILDALATVFVWIRALAVAWQRRGPLPAEAAAGGQLAERGSLSLETNARIVRAAQERGVTPDALVAAALDRYLS
jgi:hypothetical protein